MGKVVLGLILGLALVSIVYGDFKTSWDAHNTKMVAGDYAGAIIDLNTAIPLAPTSIDKAFCYNHLAEIYSKLKDASGRKAADNALIAMTEADVVNLQSAAHLDLASQYIYEGKHAIAISHLCKAWDITGMPEHKERAKSYADSYLKDLSLITPEPDWAVVITEYNQIGEPKSAISLYYRAKIKRLANNDIGAKADIIKGLALTEDNAMQLMLGKELQMIKLALGE